MNLRLRHTPWALLTLSLACATPQQITAPPPPAPAAETPRPPTFRLGTQVKPTSYKVELTVDPEQEGFSGVVEISLALSEPTQQVWLHGAGLTVKEATLTAGGQSQPARAVTEKDTFIGFLLERPVGPGTATLRVAYQGLAPAKETVGLFRQKDGDHWYAVTHFQADDARRAIPCFDEPGFKVPWQLTLRVPEKQRAFANAPVESEQPGPDGWKTVRFRPTPPLPSEVVAFAVGPFETVDAAPAGQKRTPVRIVVPRGRTAEAAYAAQATPPLLGLLEDYFGIPYPYEKLDVLALPQPVLFGAMENPGLITFQMPLLLARPEHDTLSRQREFALIQAHELAHQWFGNLVTLAWWDDTWLNESFADWLALKVTAQWQPSWSMDAERVRNRASAMRADRLVTTRRIHQPVESEGDILTAFDGDITYHKGNAVLAMFESWVGPERFRDGVRAHMRNHAHGNATAADFFQALSQASGTDLTAALSTFLDQPGVPLVSMGLRCTAGAPPTLTLSQRRFLPVGSKGAGTAEQTWQVPVCVRYGTGKQEARACTLLTAKTGELVLTGATACPDWIVPSADARGYYHTKLEGELLGRLTRGGAKPLSLTERMGLLGDAQALMASNELPVDEALGVVTSLLPTDDRDLLTGALGMVGSLRREFIPEALRPKYAAFVRRTFGDKARALGLRPRPGEDEATRLLRPSVIRVVALLGEEPSLLANARELTARWLEDRRAVSPEMVEVVLQLAAEKGDAALHQRLLAEARKTQDPSERGKLFAALGSFRDPALARATTALMLSEDFSTLEVIMGLVGGMMSEESTRELFYTYITDHFDALMARMPHELGGRMPALGASFCDATHRQGLETFFKERATRYPAGPEILGQALERVDLCIAQREALQPGLVRFLSRQ
ncbi:alanyl aminopeptidase [Archangium gephyra]|uniref:Aminopeptidase n=1 Tax=Archangium gephyra TaxID=48 RepID=A0AAC8QGK4_9BACT|nr:M1 family metallopeptidase [Archangium gephyra]AKJ07046.1 peptidase, M1 [Archangium gephyra]REG26461.1 alanyl aminopeptidase [Archangium gephyra]